MKSIAVASCVLALGGLLSGCGGLVANQVLGNAAVTVDTASAQRLSAGKVYKIGAKGQYLGPVCTDDFTKNNALKSVTVTADPASSDTLTDVLLTDNLTFGFPGIPTVQVPYDKTRVTGYTVNRATVPDSGSDFFTYVRNGVSATCRGWLDSGQYVVVQNEARATKSAKVLRGPVSGTLQWGPLSLGGAGTEIVQPGPSNVTFAIVGSNGKN